MHVEDIALEALTVADGTLEGEVGHELHLDGDFTGTLALFAAPSLGIEGEVLGGDAELLGELLLCHELTDEVVGLDIGGGVGARAAADAVLINHLHMAYALDVTLEGAVGARGVCAQSEVASQRGVEGAADER